MNSQSQEGRNEVTAPHATDMVGILRVMALNRKTAFVSIEGICTDILIPNEGYRNRAIHGDKVAIQILPSTEWTKLREVRAEFNESERSPIMNEEDMRLAAEVNLALWRPIDDINMESFSDLTLGDNVSNYTSMHPIDDKAKQLQAQPVGRVISIVDASHEKTIVGCLSVQCRLEKNKALPQTQAFVLFQPRDRRYPFLKILRNELPMAFVNNPYDLQSNIFMADISTWPQSSESPYGVNVRAIGEMGNIQAETEALLFENGCRCGLFSDECLKPLQDILGISTTTSLDSIPWQIPEEEIANRRDLREYRIFTIDPSSAKDLDDALHITSLDNGDFEIGVHIADVSYFLHPDTPLDEEAKLRATSVYLVQKVIPMLPSILCEELCSLNPNVDRLAFSCIWKMHADGTLCAEAPWFGRTVIRSCAKLDYPTAQRMIDGLIPSIPSEGLDPDAFLTTMPEEVWETHRRPISQSAWRCAADVVTMAGVARRRRIQRLANGALVLNRSKMTFRLDNDGNPIELSIYQLRESNSLVEEFMLLANFLVAQELVSKTGPIAFLRCHPQPQFSSSGKIDALADLLGVTIDMTSSMALQRSLMNIEQMGIPLYSQVATSLLAVPMSPAEYFVVGVTSPEQWKHYALAIPYYTHFTSPIRRYADVMVHRLLAQVLTGEVGEVSTRKIKAMAQVASRCNFKKMNSKSAQDRSDRMYLAVYLRKTPLLEEGVIVDIGPGSFTVLLIRLGFDVRMSVLSMLGFEGQMDLSARKLILRKDGNNSRKALAGTLQFEELELCVLKKVQLLLCASNTPPIDMQVHLVKEL